MARRESRAESVLVGKVGVLRQDVGGEVEVLVLAVQEEQVAEGLRGEGVLLEQELQLLEALGRLAIRVQQGLVVQGDRVELLLGPTKEIRPFVACSRT